VWLDILRARVGERRRRFWLRVRLKRRTFSAEKFVNSILGCGEPNRVDGARMTNKTVTGYVCGLAACSLGWLTAAAHAEDNPDGFPTPSVATSLQKMGDPYGTRAALGARGITVGVNYSAEVLGNSSGGTKRGETYFGLLEVTTKIDLEKLAGWKGLTFFANGYQIHGHGLTANNLGNIHTVSDIEATPGTRLDEIWFEQKWLNDKVALRAGSLAVDTEFFVSDTAYPTISATFGWPAAFAFALPAGANAYPLASVGGRLKLDVSDNLTTLFGVYNGDPVGPGCRVDPQLCNDQGLDFRVGDSTFAIAEFQFKYNQDKNASALPGVIKLGAWKHFGSFADQRYDTTGLSLADLASSGIAKRTRGDHSVYAIIDQKVYAGTGTQAVNVFARFASLPSDRNLIDAYGDAGVSFTGFVPNRADDVFIAAFAYSAVSKGARGADRDNFDEGNQTIVRDREALLELTYIAKIIPGLTLQPDFQYVWHPGGKVDDGTGKPVGDAAVWALRTVINY
jgi:porin